MSTDVSKEGRLPLFYREPCLLSSHLHGAWRLREGDFGFASTSAYVPIVVGEFAAASRHYPILFADDKAVPLVLLGLETINLFVTDGQWAEETYIPAYVRRYPFGFVAVSDPDRYVLAVDAASERVVRSGTEGVQLFDGEQPSVLTTQALEFCEIFQRDAKATQEFCSALVALDLLIERRADATLADGRALGVQGFRIVDAERFMRLSDETVNQWHRKGWLALIHFHLASLDRFSVLLSRQNRRQSDKRDGRARFVTDASPSEVMADI